MYLVARNSTLLHANNQGADQPAHPRSQLALESMLHAKNENKKFYRQQCVCGSRQLQRGRRYCFSMEVRTSFSSRIYMTACNGLGPLPLLPLCLRLYQSFKQFEFTLVRHFRDFLYQRDLGHMYCRAWSIHKPSANYIS